MVDLTKPERPVPEDLQTPLASNEARPQHKVHANLSWMTCASTSGWEVLSRRG